MIYILLFCFSYKTSHIKPDTLSVPAFAVYTPRGYVSISFLIIDKYFQQTKKYLQVCHVTHLKVYIIHLLNYCSLASSVTTASPRSTSRSLISIASSFDSESLPSDVPSDESSRIISLVSSLPITISPSS